jgi:Carboxypeptidase regulatory-like domain
MMTGKPKFAVSLLTMLGLCAPAAFSATPPKLSGSIAGFVKDSSGIPQMGASVMLFNRYERLIERTFTNERGTFGFEALSPDLYSVRVSLASFVPAMKQKIAVQPGMQSLLYVDLASVFSSIELVYAAPGQGALMSEDWKMTLKGSAATRPILRALPEISMSDPSKKDKSTGGVFSDTRGMVKVSAGDPGSLGGTSSQTDLGTAFAVSTSVFGRNQLQVSGNVGYSTHSGVPTTGFRTSYSRDGVGPEVAVTMQQVYLPARADLASLTGQDGAPALRTVSAAIHDSVPISENMRLDYGMSLDSVSFLAHMNYMSKFVRLSYSLGDKGTVEFAYSSGAPPSQAIAGNHATGNDVRGDSAALADDLVALSMLPRLALLDGRTTIQRSQDFELGYEKRLRDTTFDLTLYRENVTNAAMTISAPEDFFPVGDVLPDISSKSSVFNAGSFRRLGYAASATQAIGDKIHLGASFGSGGALELRQHELQSPTADELRSKIQGTQRFWVSARASATMPGTGTEITSSYQWMDYTAIMPSHFYLTQRLSPDPGLNIRVRQPIPSFPGMPGRLEATAELRNGLGQGYLPIAEGGQHVLLIQSPRALRGGLSFIF